MKLLSMLLVPALLLLVVAGVPTAAASPSLVGSATSCGQLYSCYFVLNGSGGTGYASTGFGSVSFRLPGETNVSHGVYTSKVVNQSGTVDRVQGSLIATDINSGKIVIGSTDTNITVTTHCSHNGCGYTYAMKNGTIRIGVTPFDATTTTVVCSPSSFGAGGSTRCTATVTDLANRTLVPTGNVTFSTYAGAGLVGTFAHHGTCSLVSGNCTLRFTAGDETVGSFQIFGTYHGFHHYYKGVGSTYVSVTGN